MCPRSLAKTWILQNFKISDSLWEKKLFCWKPGVLPQVTLLTLSLSRIPSGSIWKIIVIAVTGITARNVFFIIRKIDNHNKWKIYVFIAWVKLNLELDALSIRLEVCGNFMSQYSILIQFLTSNIGGVLHAPILDKWI